MQQVRYITWLGGADGRDKQLMGPVHAQLNHLAAIGLPVLSGFVVTSEAMATWLLQPKLLTQLSKTAKAIDWRQHKSMASGSKALAKLIEGADQSPEFVEHLSMAYQQLVDRSPDQSPTVQLQADLSLEGSGASATVYADSLVSLKKALRQVVASYFNYIVIDAAVVDSLLRQQFSISILIQPVVAAEVSGTLNTERPWQIKAISGRPEPLASALLIPDRYTIEPSSLTILATDINRQEWRLVGSTAAGKHQKISNLDQSAQKLDQSQLHELAKLGVIAEQQTDYPLRLNWCFDRMGQLWLTAASLATASTAGFAVPTEQTTQPLATGNVLLPGMAVGAARLITHAKDWQQLQADDIAFVESAQLLHNVDVTNLKGLVVMAGHLTDAERSQLHEAGTPTLLAPEVRHNINNGQLITLDCRQGAIYVGKYTPPIAVSPIPTTTVTATSIYTVIAEATAPAQLQDLVTDGIGYLSAKAIWQGIGNHPRQLLKQDSSRLLATQLVDELCHYAQAITPRTVVYVLDDLSSEDWRNLPGGASHETAEANPLVGYRGAHRSLQEPDLLKIQLEAIRRAREEYGCTNLHLMLPFVRTISEFTAVYHIILGSGLRPGADFRLWLLCETPASLAFVGQLAQQGSVQGVVFAIDHLAQLLLGVDYANPQLAHEYPIHTPAVVTSIQAVVAYLRQFGVPALVYGSHLATNPELIEQLVHSGVTGLIVDHQSVQPTRQLTASVEQRLILNKVLDLP